MPKQPPIREIRIKVVSQNKGELKKIAKDLGVLNKNVKSTAKSLKGFGRGFKFTIAGLGIREVTRMADSFQLLRDRIKVFTGDADSAAVTFENLQQVARRTRTSVASIGEVFNRVALATQELGLSIEEITGVTEGLQQTFRLSGSTIAEATAATIQLTQGLSSGALRGQELRSVLEANAVFVDILSKELDIGRGKLIKFAETGAITSKVVLKALAKNFDTLTKNANKLGITFEQVAIILKDAFAAKIDELNQKMGISSKFAKAMFLLIDNLDAIFKLVVLLAGAAGIGKLIVSLRQLGSLLAAKNLIAFGIAMGPVGLAVAALAGALGFLALSMDKLGKKDLPAVNAQIRRMKKTVKQANNEFKDARTALNNYAQAAKDSGREVDKSSLTYNNMRRKVALTGKTFADANGKLKGLQRTLADIRRTSSGKRGNPLAGQITKDDAFNLKELNRLLKEGKISFEAYQEAISKNDLKKVNEDFANGKTNTQEYAAALAALPGGTDGAIEGLLALDAAIKKSSSTMALTESVFSNTFKGLEDAMVEFATNGKFVWRDFANSIIKEIVRIQIRAAIIKPLLGLFSGGLNFGSAIPAAGSLDSSSFQLGGDTLLSAKGNAFNSGAALSVFGESGPEAILPLTRGSGGELGVKSVGGDGGGGSGVVVNVFNSSGSSVETKESTGANGQKQIDVLITGTVKQMFSSGALDRQMSTNFGLSRKGT